MGCKCSWRDCDRHYWDITSDNHDKTFLFMKTVNDNMTRPLHTYELHNFIFTIKIKLIMLYRSKYSDRIIVQAGLFKVNEQIVTFPPYGISTDIITCIRVSISIQSIVTFTVYVTRLYQSFYVRNIYVGSFWDSGATVIRGNTGLTQWWSRLWTPVTHVYWNATKYNITANGESYSTSLASGIQSNENYIENLQCNIDLYNTKCITP